MKSAAAAMLLAFALVASAERIIRVGELETAPVDKPSENPRTGNRLTQSIPPRTYSLSERQREFSSWLLKSTAVTRLEIKDVDVIWVQLEPYKYTTRKNLKEIARFIAKSYSLQTGIEGVACTIWPCNQEMGKTWWSAIGTY